MVVPREEKAEGTEWSCFFVTNRVEARDSLGCKYTTLTQDKSEIRHAGEEAPHGLSPLFSQ